jgi:hypothetical protein
MTNEFFQPVRLYYSIPNRIYVTGKFRRLRCMVEVPPERCWQWLFDGEAKSLQFAEATSKYRRKSVPSCLGVFAFPGKTA